MLAALQLHVLRHSVGFRHGRVLGHHFLTDPVVLEFRNQTSELSPLVPRLCREETDCSRSGPDGRSGKPRDLWIATAYQPTTSCSWSLAARRGILSFRTPSVVERQPGRPQA